VFTAVAISLAFDLMKLPHAGRWFVENVDRHRATDYRCTTPSRGHGAQRSRGWLVCRRGRVGRPGRLPRMADHNAPRPRPPPRRRRGKATHIQAASFLTAVDPRSAGRRRCFAPMPGQTTLRRTGLARAIRLPSYPTGCPALSWGQPLFRPPNKRKPCLVGLAASSWRRSWAWRRVAIRGSRPSSHSSPAAPPHRRGRGCAPCPRRRCVHRSSVAPVTIDIFNEPICPPCAASIRSNASDIATAVNNKKLACAITAELSRRQVAQQNYSTRAVAATTASQRRTARRSTTTSTRLVRQRLPAPGGRAEDHRQRTGATGQTVGADPTVITCIKSGDDVAWPERRSQPETRRCRLNANGTPFVWTAPSGELSGPGLAHEADR